MERERVANYYFSLINNVRLNDAKFKRSFNIFYQEERELKEGIEDSEYLVFFFSSFNF